MSSPLSHGFHKSRHRIILERDSDDFPKVLTAFPVIDNKTKELIALVDLKWEMFEEIDRILLRVFDNNKSARSPKSSPSSLTSLLIPEKIVMKYLPHSDYTFISLNCLLIIIHSNVIIAIR